MIERGNELDRDGDGKSPYTKRGWTLKREKFYMLEGECYR